MRRIGAQARPGTVPRPSRNIIFTARRGYGRKEELSTEGVEGRSMTILDTINSPQDLKALSADKLEELAAEIGSASLTLSLIHI